MQVARDLAARCPRLDVATISEVFTLALQPALRRDPGDCCQRRRCPAMSLIGDVIGGGCARGATNPSAASRSCPPLATSLTNIMR